MSFVEFLLKHYELIILFVVAIINLIVLICKKKVKVNNVLFKLLEQLPGYINKAEELYDKGDKKFSYVFNCAVRYLISITDLTAQEVIAKYSGNINDAIENILTTPQKKQKGD